MVPKSFSIENFWSQNIKNIFEHKLFLLNILRPVSFLKILLTRNVFHKKFPVFNIISENLFSLPLFMCEYFCLHILKKVSVFSINVYNVCCSSMCLSLYEYGRIECVSTNVYGCLSTNNKRNKRNNNRKKK